MTDHISFDGQVTNIDLDLARNDQSVLSIGPLFVQIPKLVYGRVIDWRGRESLLHWTFDKAIR